MHWLTVNLLYMMLLILILYVNFMTIRILAYKDVKKNVLYYIVFFSKLHCHLINYWSSESLLCKHVSYCVGVLSMYYGTDIYICQLMCIFHALSFCIYNCRCLPAVCTIILWQVIIIFIRITTSEINLVLCIGQPWSWAITVVKSVETFLKISI